MEFTHDCSVRAGRPLHLRFAAALALVLLTGTPVAFAQDLLQVTLRAPETVRAVLEQHLRVLSRPDQAVPELRADRAALLRRTRREVARILATEGFFTPGVELERAEHGQWVLIVEPGLRARVTAVELRFTGHLAEAETEGRREALRRAWSLPIGEAFRQEAWDGAKQGLLDSVARRDYAAARISESRAEVDPATGEVRLAVTVDSGPPFFLGAIEVEGLERLPTDLVSRLGGLKQGERFDQERLLAFQSALQAAPQFASVIVDVERDPARAEAAPLRVQVSEARSRHLGFGAGYSTNTGARTEVNWRDVNLLGRAWELSTGLRIEQRRQSAYADVFLPPALQGHRDSLGAVVERSDIEGLASARQAIGIVRSRLKGEIETSIGLRYQRETLRPLGGVDSRRNALTVNGSWTLRRVDDLLDPHAGYVVRVELGGGARALLSDQDFVRSYGRVVRYQPVGERDVLILRGEAGVTVARSRDGIPQDFLFRTGGAQSVRGYAYESLGVEEGRATLGGRWMAAVSAEYVHWFQPQWGVAAFIDAGDAADDRKSFRLRQGYGVGARWRSPAGPIALDLAYGQQDRRLRMHFAIAVAF